MKSNPAQNDEWQRNRSERDAKAREKRQANAAKIHQERMREVRAPSISDRSRRLAEERRATEEHQGGGVASQNWSRMATTPRHQQLATTNLATLTPRRPRA